MIARCGRPGLVCNTRAGHGRCLHYEAFRDRVRPRCPDRGVVGQTAVASRSSSAAQVQRTTIRADQGQPRGSRPPRRDQGWLHAAQRGADRCACAAAATRSRSRCRQSGSESWPVMGVPPMAVAVSRWRGYKVVLPDPGCAARQGPRDPTGPREGEWDRGSKCAPVWDETQRRRVASHPAR
jgi:hypothetical protein